MKSWKVGLYFLVAFILQSGLVNIFALWGRTPNLILALVVIFSFLYDNRLYGFVYGAIFGVLFDICFSQAIGVTAIPLVIISLIIMMLDGIYNVENIINLAIISSGTIVGYSVLNFIMLRIVGNPVPFIRSLNYMPISWIGTFIVVLIIYLVLIKDVVKYRREDRRLI